jgi:HTH-type transcriptional regulator / antitoxin HigA
MTVTDEPLIGKFTRKSVGRPQEYRDLLGQFMPHVIRTEDENERYIRVLQALAARPRLTGAERAMMDLLTLLIEQFEEAHYALPPASPIEHVRELMAAQGLKQKDLVGIFPTESIVSEVLHGKRPLTAEHIRRLSARFHVSPALFL